MLSLYHCVSNLTLHYTAVIMNVIITWCYNLKLILYSKKPLADDNEDAKRSVAENLRNWHVWECVSLFYSEHWRLGNLGIPYCHCFHSDNFSTNTEFILIFFHSLHLHVSEFDSGMLHAPQASYQKVHNSVQ